MIRDVQLINTTTGKMVVIRNVGGDMIQKTTPPVMLLLSALDPTMILAAVPLDGTVIVTWDQHFKVASSQMTDEGFVEHNRDARPEIEGIVDGIVDEDDKKDNDDGA